MSKQFLAIIAAIIVVFVGVAVFTGNKSDDDTASTKTAAATNHTKGQGSTGVKLVEYGDFQCPYCAAYHPTLEQVVAEYGDKITFQFAHYPIVSLHQNAFAASRAAEAAGKQDKFWDMYDKLYQNADPNGASGWVASNAPTTFFNQFATQIGLNLEQYKKDYASSAVNNAINADIAKGNKAGVEGTPSFFLDGKKVTIANNIDDFRKVLDEAIKAKAGKSERTPMSSGATEQPKPE